MLLLLCTFNRDATASALLHGTVIPRSDNPLRLSSVSRIGKGTRDYVGFHITVDEHVLVNFDATKQGASILRISIMIIERWEQAGNERMRHHIFGREAIYCKQGVQGL